LESTAKSPLPVIHKTVAESSSIYRPAILKVLGPN
jgi:hypothetical protein